MSFFETLIIGLSLPEFLFEASHIKEGRLNQRMYPKYSWCYSARTPFVMAVIHILTKEKRIKKENYNNYNDS